MVFSPSGAILSLVPACSERRQAERNAG